MKSSYKRILLRAVLVVAFIPGINSCSVIRLIADRISPPVTSIDQQYASVESNLTQAGGFEADIGAFVEAATLSDVLESEIKKAAFDNQGEDIQLDEFTPKVRFVSQGIAIETNFDGVANKYNIRVRGDLTGMVAISTVGDRLLLRPALDKVKLEKLRSEGGGAVNPDLSIPVNKVVENFVANLNGILATKPLVVDLNWTHVAQVDLASLNQDPALFIRADRKTIERHFAGSLIYIDQDGVSLLISLSESPATGSEENEYPDPKPGMSITATRFKERFREYSVTFRQKWEQKLDPLVGKSPAELYVAKAEIASLLNAVTDQAITINYNFNMPEAKFNEVVEVEKSDVDCQKVYEPFKRKRYKRRSCDWSCLRCVDLCPIGECEVCTDDPACKASRVACNVKEEALVLQDNIEWEAERIQHNLDQEARVAACNVWRETTSILAVGRFSGDAKGNGEVIARVDGIQFDAMLDYIDLKNFHADVSGKAQVDMKATPHDLGHVFFCVAPARLGWSGSYNAQMPSATRRLSVASARDGNDLVLQVQLPEIEYKASISPSPLQALMTDRDFIINCSFAATVLLGTLPTAEVAGILGLKEGSMIFDAALGRYSGIQKLGWFEQRIKAMSVEVGGRSPIVVTAAMGSKSIQLNATKSQ